MPTTIGRQSAARLAGAAIGSGAITGFPTIWAQNIKNVTLRQFGTGVSNLNGIAEKVKSDLGLTLQILTLQMTALDTDAMTLIQTVKLNGVKSMAWLTDVLERIVSARTKAHELHTLLPWNWREPSRSAAAVPNAALAA